MEQQDEISLTIETVALFTEECIMYVLKYHNFDWFPPVSMEALRKYSMFDLFTVEIGRALVHDCMVIESQLVANMTGFNVQAWLQMPVNEARVYVNQHFLDFTFVLPVGHQFKHLFLWTFACSLCRKAVESNRRIFISHVFTQLLQIMYSNYRYLDHYEYLHIKATSYNHIHFYFHSLLGDEGYLTE